MKRSAFRIAFDLSNVIVQTSALSQLHFLGLCLDDDEKAGVVRVPPEKTRSWKIARLVLHCQFVLNNVYHADAYVSPENRPFERQVLYFDLMP
jgi:hypothetical protein